MRVSKGVYTDIIKAVVTDVGYDGVVKAVRRVVRKRQDMPNTMKKLDAVLTTCIDDIDKITHDGGD